jgi:hypothetical protein
MKKIIKGNIPEWVYELWDIQVKSHQREGR